MSTTLLASPNQQDRAAGYGTLLATASAADGVSRREFISLLTAAGLLTACSRSEEPPPPTPATRTVDSDFGPVDVPANPQRVVATYTEVLDWAVALDLPIVGAPGARGLATNPFPPFLPADALRDAQRLTTYADSGIDLEPLAATRPDLILNTFTERETHDRLAKVAPTLTLSPYTEPARTWQQVLPLYAAAVGREERVQHILLARRAQANAARAAVKAGPLAGGTFVAGYGDSTQFVLYGRDIQPVPVLTEELGLRPLPSTPAKGVQNISLENLDQINADVIFITADPPEGGYEPDVSQQKGLRSSAVWRRLRAVQNKRVFNFPVDLVFGGPAADQALLALLTRQLS